jgi:hypothetical protein
LNTLTAVAPHWYAEADPRHLIAGDAIAFAGHVG